MAKKRITFTFDEETIALLKKISDETMIPQARIAEQAILGYIAKMKTDK